MLNTFSFFSLSLSSLFLMRNVCVVHRRRDAVTPWMHVKQQSGEHSYTHYTSPGTALA